MVTDKENKRVIEIESVVVKLPSDLYFLPEGNLLEEA